MGQIENAIKGSLFNSSKEKTFSDKVLAREDVAKIGEIMAKEKLSRSDMLTLMYLMTSTEAKLQNYDEWDRYIINKYFLWIREFVRFMEHLKDYEDGINTRFPDNKRIPILFNNCVIRMEHNTKFAIDVYLNLSRTTQSRESSAFIELLQNRYEIRYPDGGLGTPEQEKKGWWGGAK